MEPAKTIIDRLGGDTAVAKVLGIHRTRVAAWKRPKPAGSGGFIPGRHIPALLKMAKDNHVLLSASDFFPTNGRVA